jgi:biotin operon repressor
MVASGHSQGYGLSDEAYIGEGESVKDKTRVGALQYSILKLLAETGLRQFTLQELWKALNIDRRRVHQAIVYLLRRGVVARVARGLYRLLVDPWELLSNAIIQGPNGKSVKDSHDTRLFARAGGRFVDCVAGLFFDNVRGYTLAGGYVSGDRGRVLSREDLGRFASISYAEVSVATGTRLMEGLGSITIYFKCKGFGLEVVCSDWVEWRPPSGFYKQHSVVDAVNLFRSRVLPYAFGLVGRSGVIVRAPVERFRAALYGLARQLYLVIRPSSNFNNSNGCRAPSVEPNGDGNFSVCFNCPPTLWRRLLNSARAARRDWNSIIVEVLSGVLP